MKTNIILSLLAPCACLANSPSYGMDVEDTRTSVVPTTPSLAGQVPTTIKQSTPSLEEQLENVVSFIQQRKAQGLPVKMVLGARKADGERICDKAWIFLDQYYYAKPSGLNSHVIQEERPHICADFNREDHLSLIAGRLKNSLD